MNWILLIVLIVVLLIVYSNKHNVRSLKFLDYLQIDFFKLIRETVVTIAPVFSLDPVISSDGNIYKIHLLVSILSKNSVGIINWKLKISRCGSMIFKQYFFQNQQGNHAPLGKIHDLPLINNQNFVIGIEFEPEMGWSPISFDKRLYRAELLCKTSSNNIRAKFCFRVREQNLTTLKLISQESKKQKKVAVISLPIV